MVVGRRVRNLEHDLCEGEESVHALGGKVSAHPEAHLVVTRHKLIRGEEGCCATVVVCHPEFVQSGYKVGPRLRESRLLAYSGCRALVLTQ